MNCMLHHFANIIITSRPLKTKVRDIQLRPRFMDISKVQLRKPSSYGRYTKFSNSK